MKTFHGSLERAAELLDEVSAAWGWAGTQGAGRDGGKGCLGKELRQGFVGGDRRGGNSKVWGLGGGCVEIFLSWIISAALGESLSVLNLLPQSVNWTSAQEIRVGLQLQGRTV